MCQYLKKKCCAKGSRKDFKIQEFIYRDTANVEPEMYDYTSNNWSHWDSNEKLKEKKQQQQQQQQQQQHLLSGDTISN